MCGISRSHRESFHANAAADRLVTDLCNAVAARLP